MSTHIATCVARAIGGGARVLTSPLSLEQARAATAPARTMVFVTPEIAHGWVKLEAAEYTVVPYRADSGGLTGGGEIVMNAPLDGELGAYLPRIPISVTHIERAVASSDVVALGCGDVAAAMHPEVVAVGRHKVQVGRAGDGRFSVRAEATWASLSPVAPSPLREPIGGAAIVRGHGVLVGITDRAEGFLLSPALAKVHALSAPVPLGGDWGCANRAGIALGAPKPCDAGGKHLDEPTPFDAFASGHAVDAEGRTVSVLATRDPLTRQVTLRQGTTTATLPSAGGALAIADLDLDGQPEIVSSVDTDHADEDAIVVSTWAHDGTITERLRVPVKDGVRALAVCPAEDVRMAPIVAATPGGLWIVR
jgi:hypothetical protein